MKCEKCMTEKELCPCGEEYCKKCEADAHKGHKTESKNKCPLCGGQTFYCDRCGGGMHCMNPKCEANPHKE